MIHVKNTFHLKKTAMTCMKNAAMAFFCGKSFRFLHPYYHLIIANFGD